MIPHTSAKNSLMLGSALALFLAVDIGSFNTLFLKKNYIKCYGIKFKNYENGKTINSICALG
jgi:hypothetical protein